MNRTLIALLMLLLTSCGSTRTITRPEVAVPDTQDQLILATLWYQRSAEMKALYYQCFRNAEVALSGNLSKSDGSKPCAVVMDIDETVLDNSPFQGWQVLENKGFSNEEWNRWVRMAKAAPLPGAVKFTRFADSLGVDVFYISNRSIAEVGPTIENMRTMGFADADSAHMMFREAVSSKVPRRAEVEKTHQIILLVGDNLGDLDGVFEKRPDGFGIAEVEAQKDKFGTRYIILPNPMYGTWLSEMLKKAEGTTTSEKLKSLLQGF